MNDLDNNGGRGYCNCNSSWPMVDRLNLKYAWLNVNGRKTCDQCGCTKWVYVTETGVKAQNELDLSVQKGDRFYDYYERGRYEESDDEEEPWLDDEHPDR